MTEKPVVRHAAASDSHATLRAAANSLPYASRQTATNHIQNRYQQGRFLFRTNP